LSSEVVDVACFVETYDVIVQSSIEAEMQRNSLTGEQQ